MKNISILGSTGSIGRNTLDVIDMYPDRFQVLGLSAWNNAERLAEQAKKFHPRLVCIGRPEKKKTLRSLLEGTGIEITSGPDGLNAVATLKDVHMIVSGIVGGAGFLPTYQAIRAGKDVALANKETLVMGGSLIMETAREHGVALLPVDSEHNALHQSLKAGRHGEVKKLILTASGGPFLHLPEEEFPSITPESALRHPTWKMGPKITIDSATLMNKGLEIIEASFLFSMPPQKIEVVIHPQSVVHSLVEYIDGSLICQMGPTDMRLPILYCLSYPERLPGPYPPLTLGKLTPLQFLPPDREKFPCLRLAYEALEAGGRAPVVLNAANEVAVHAFLEGKTGFMDIPKIIENMIKDYAPGSAATVEEILETDRETRRAAMKLISE